jgi:hypothetical protein
MRIVDKFVRLKSTLNNDLGLLHRYRYRYLCKYGLHLQRFGPRRILSSHNSGTYVATVCMKVTECYY